MTKCHSEDYYELSHNITHSTVSGIAAYRSALTLDWLADEDSRQRQLAHAFETQEPLMSKELSQSECMAFDRPAPGKVARLMLELLKNIEGDDGVVQELTKTLIRVKLLIETSMLEAEPDLESLVQTPQLLQGEPHVTLPRLVAVVWALATDPVTTKASGWCAIKKLTEYLMVAPPPEIAARMRAIDPIIARARYILEDFMQSVTPMYMKAKAKTTLIDIDDLRPNSRHRVLPPTRSTTLSEALTIDSSPTGTEEANSDAPPIPESFQVKRDTASKLSKLSEVRSNGSSVVLNSFACLVLPILVI